MLLPKSCYSTYKLYSLLCIVLIAVGNEGIASILTRERVHHEPQVPDGTSRLKQRHQLIFI